MGVAILFKENFEYKITGEHKDQNGRVISLDIRICDISTKLIHLDAPNRDTPEFCNSINDIFENSTQNYTIICGDFNLILNPDIDSFNYKHINNPNSRKK